MAARIETSVGCVTVEKKGYRARLWSPRGYAGSVMKVDGVWNWGYADQNVDPIKLKGYKSRAKAIRDGVKYMADNNLFAR